MAILRTQVRSSTWQCLWRREGQERTEPEYGTLLGKAGLRLTRVVPAADWQRHVLASNGYLELGNA